MTEKRAPLYGTLCPLCITRIFSPTLRTSLPSSTIPISKIISCVHLAATTLLLNLLAAEGNTRLGGRCSTGLVLHPSLDLTGHGKKACSTFVEVFAEVSKNSIPSPSANSLPCSVDTTRLPSRSHLLPTRSLFTFSHAYRSISWSHCFTLLKDSLSVTSYTTIIPCAPL